MKNSTVILVLVTLLFSSCSKEEQRNIVSYNEDISSFKELNVPQGFDFKGANTITVLMHKQEGVASDARSLVTISDKSGNIYLKHNSPLSTETELKIEVPTDLKELKVTNTAGVEKVLPILNNRLIIK